MSLISGLSTTLKMLVSGTAVVEDAVAGVAELSTIIEEAQTAKDAADGDLAGIEAFLNVLVSHKDDIYSGLSDILEEIDSLGIGTTKAQAALKVIDSAISDLSSTVATVLAASDSSDK